MILEYCKYMGGAHPVSEIMQMTPREFLFWWRLRERKIIEDSIIHDHAKRDKPIPSQQRLERMIDKKISEYKEGL